MAFPPQIGAGFKGDHAQVQKVTAGIDSENEAGN
jgi:hypothetical protein